MICTVTFNPSLDYVLGLDSLRLGGVNRASREAIMPGGKGINVSIVLNNLGHPSHALGFIAGFIAGYLESGGDLDQAFRMGLCTGSASAFSLGLATREQVDELLEQI